jgi:hypothetical protein
MRQPTVSPADFRPALDPCSLDPDRCFCSAFAELIRDQLSPIDFCNCTIDVRATEPNDSLSSQGRRPRPSSFSSAHYALLLAKQSNEWRAALRPFESAPVLVPSSYPDLPNRDADPTAPPVSTYAEAA